MLKSEPKLAVNVGISIVKAISKVEARVDNGPEFTSKDFELYTKENPSGFIMAFALH